MPNAISALILSVVLLSVASNGYVCNPNAALPAAYQDMDVPCHLRWARFLDDNIIPGSNLTAYENTVIEVEWGNYTCDPTFLSITDCSGLVDALFSKCYDLTLAARAVVTAYSTAIEDQLYGFSWIQDVSDVRIGDIFTIRYAPGRGDTGHMAIVNSLPFKIDPIVPLEPGTDQWAFPMLDQTANFHYINDSRWDAQSEGLGMGIMKIYTYNGTGTIKGYSWSLNPVSVYYDYTSNNTIYIGRLDTSIYTGTTAGSTSGPQGPTPSPSSATATGNGGSRTSDAAASATISWTSFAIVLTAISLCIPSL